MLRHATKQTDSRLVEVKLAGNEIINANGDRAGRQLQARHGNRDSMPSVVSSGKVARRTRAEHSNSDVMPVLTDSARDAGATQECH